jgi:hypothetical protein
LVSALVVALAIPYGVLRYRVARSAAFCDAVESLPRAELEQFATRCEHLVSTHCGKDAGLQVIVDSSTLGQSALVGRPPYEIVVKRGTVGIKYFKGNWRYSTLAVWDEDSSPNGEAIMVLKITYGTFGWRVLCQRESLKDGKTKAAARANADNALRFADEP